jgi:hypothetical protein
MEGTTAGGFIEAWWRAGNTLGGSGTPEGGHGGEEAPAVGVPAAGNKVLDGGIFDEVA